MCRATNTLCQGVADPEVEFSLYGILGMDAAGILYLILSALLLPSLLVSRGYTLIAGFGASHPYMLSIPLATFLFCNAEE
ncbi:hypothetical protein Pelo_15625 [Pelomyxa schiedti]|nr:hypothetical protein Pelo_15625 [Pelomyxa schiedti]